MWSWIKAPDKLEFRPDLYGKWAVSHRSQRGRERLVQISCSSVQQLTKRYTHNRNFTVAREEKWSQQDSTKIHRNANKSWWDISVCTEAVDQPTNWPADIPIPTVTPKTSQLKLIYSIDSSADGSPALPSLHDDSVICLSAPGKGTNCECECSRSRMNFDATF